MATTNRDIADRLLGIKQKLAEVDRQRAQAEAQLEVAAQRLAEIDKQIAALGVKPEKAEAEVEKLEAALTAELETWEAKIREEEAECRAILSGLGAGK